MNAAAHELWKDSPVARPRPRDVREVQNCRFGHLATDHSRGKIQMIVLKEDVRGFRPLFRLMDNSLRDRLIDRDIATFPGFIDGTADIGGPRCVPHEVLHKPEQWVAENVVVTLVG